jgi:cephalosporin-C deacetylase-like acetyl esterase
MRFLFASAFFLLTFSPAIGQQKKEPKVLPGDEMIDAYLKKRTEELSKNFMAGAKSKDEWLKLRPKLKEQYLDMLGLWPLPEKTPLNAKVNGTIEHGDVTIEKLHFQSKPGLYVTGNLYRPKASRERERPEKLPTILYVCGHSGRGRDGNKTAFQDHGMWFASNGYVCLIIDTLQLGEVAGKHHGTYNLNRLWWQSLGYTPAGVECWNGVRAIDYLVTRKDVDPERIGVTGISGGGAATFWIAAADERVKVAVPVSGMSDLESYVTNKVVNGHCDCMFLVNTYQWEWTTIAAMIAPRPMLFANSDKDGIFPMDGNRRIIKRLRDCYTMLGAPDLVDEYVSVGGHDYRPDLRVAIFKFINKHLKKDNGPVKDADFKALAGKELRVFPEDSDLPKDELNSKIDETFVTAKRPKLPEAKGFEEWKKDLIGQLRERSFRVFPERIPTADSDGDEVGVLIPLKVGDGIRFHTIPIVPKGPPHVTLLILNPEEEILTVTREWAKPFLDKGVVVAVLPRGAIPSKWTRKNPPNTVERSLALLGSTVDTGRVLDVAGAALLMDSTKKSKIPIRVVGRGQSGVIAAYAALFEPSIREIVIVDPPTSHRDGPHFLNVIRVLDIPDALGLLAPRPLTIIGGKDKAFDRTAEIYKLAGAADKLKRE